MIGKMPYTFSYSQDRPYRDYKQYNHARKSKKNLELWPKKRTRNTILTNYTREKLFYARLAIITCVQWTELLLLERSLARLYKGGFSRS